MSVRVRSSFALVTAATLILLGSGAAAASDELAPAPLSTGSTLEQIVPEPVQELAQPPAGTDPAPAEAAAAVESTVPATEQPLIPAEGPSIPAPGAPSPNSAEPPAGENGAPEDEVTEAAASCIEVLETFEADLDDLGLDGARIVDVLAGGGTSAPPSDEELDELFGGLSEEDADLLVGYLETLETELATCLPEVELSAPPAGGGAGGDTVAPPAASTTQATYYANCDDARAQGVTDIPRGAPGYRPALDRDNDGIGCEDDTATAAQPVTASAGKLAYTGVTVAPMVAWGAAMLLTGGGLTLTGRRRV